MAIREIRTYPDPVLADTASPVEDFGAEFQRLVDDMVETMYAAPGIGLAAPQVGVSQRLIVIDLGGRADDGSEDPGLIVLANPELELSGETLELEEGCLSLPGYTTNVKRPSNVLARGHDRHGSALTIEAQGLLAVALQHETDHLVGKLIIDRISPLKRRFFVKRIKKSLAGAG